MMPSIGGASKAVIDVLAQAGDSKYSLVPTGVAVLALMALYFFDPGTMRARLYAWLAGAAGFIFVSIAYSGILINVIKITVGRTRPHVADGLYWPEFHPFALVGNYHSFPSGHANTVFAIAFAVGFLAPALRRYLLILAAGLAFCRVLQFRHFVSDSLGGALLALATTLWLRDMFARHAIVFRVGKDGRVTFTAPGRLLVRRLKRGFRSKRYRTSDAMALQIAERGD